jgi:GTPase SAR1 family protein
VKIFDSSGQEEFDELRVINYKQADVFLVCFSVTSPSSLEHVKSLVGLLILHVTVNQTVTALYVVYHQDK